tara:strand:+ start:21 stop:227 length:207 start_codon:yes stop_codon:yes gene_type:complete
MKDQEIIDNAQKGRIIAGFGFGLIFVAVLSFSYAAGASFESKDITRSCELTGTFVVSGTAYNCEVKND